MCADPAGESDSRSSDLNPAVTSPVSLHPLPEEPHPLLPKTPFVLKISSEEQEEDASVVRR